MLSRKPPPRWASAAIILLATALLFAPGPAQHMESLGTQLFAPVQLGLSGTYSRLEAFWGSIQRVAEIADQNDAYRVEIDRLQSELVRLKELELENEVLRRLLSLKQQTQPGELLPVQVIASDVSPFVQSITIDRGANDGVRTEMPVVTWKGLVGRVIRANATTAKVLLLTDVNSSVSVRIQDPDSRATGIARGRSDGTLLLEHVPQQERLALGQLVITSGLGGVFPEGLVVGKVAKVVQNDYEVFQRASVAPAVDTNKLEHLYVILSDVQSQPE
ncbi:MAG: rod shape-determining protein MreC [Chloroflexi bacterium]|nr:rod shape-determining protein MreC [Chloroflexota bacterium]